MFVVAQIVAWIYSQTTILVVFLIFLTPLLVFLVSECINKRRKYMQTHCRDRFKFMNNIYERELHIRFLIESLLEARSKDKDSEVEDYKQQIKAMFEDLRKQFYFCKLVSILEFMYIFSVLEDENLAGLKLSFTIDGKHDIEFDFSEFKCRKLLEDSYSVHSEEHDYVKYRKMYENVKKIDEKACLIQLEFWNELSTDLINVKKIESLSYALHKSTANTYKIGKELYEKYPNKAAVLRLYGSFLMDIYNDTEKGNELLSKSENIRTSDKYKLRNETKFSYFDNSTGVIIVSGNPDSVGMVEYVSPEAYSILGLNNSLRLNLHISNFSPPPLNNAKLHKSILVKILKSREFYEIDIPINNFIMSSDGFLVEVLMQMRCLAWESHPFFIMSIKRTKTRRECLLYDSDYSILAHTKNFGTMFKFSESHYIVGMSINNFIPDIAQHIQRLGKSVVFEYDTDQDRLYVKIEEQIYHNEVYRILQLTNNIAEAKNWNSSFSSKRKFSTLNSYSIVRTLSENLIAIGLNSFMIRTGILKNHKLDYRKKNLKVSIEDKLIIHELPWTDFKAGKSKLAKDAKLILKPKFEVEIPTLIDKSNVSSSSDPSEIIELKDIKAQEVMEDLEQNKISPGKKSHSLSSSMVSSNAGASRSLVVQKLITRVNSSIKRFKFVFFSTNVIVVLAISAMMTYLIINAKFYKDDMLVPHICMVRYSTVTLAEYVRFLNIHSQLSNDTVMESSIRTKLSNTIEEFSYYIDSLEEKIEKSSTAEAESIYNEEISTFVKHEDDFVLKKETLIDALRNLHAESNHIYSTPIEDIQASNPHFYYVIRNGVEETSKTLNNTVYTFLEIEKQNLKGMIEVVNILGAGAAFLIVICFFGVILPTLIHIEKANQNVWRFFYSLQFHVIQEMRFKCEERLESMHGSDLMKKPQKSYRFKESLTRKSTRNSKKWRSIMLKLSIYYICSTVLFIYIYCFLIVDFSEVVRQKPDIINWASMIISAIEEGMFWRLEISYRNTPFGYFKIIPNYQINEPYERMEEMINLWTYSEKKLLTELNFHIDSSPEQQSALFENGCIYEPCSVYLMHGIHPALIKLRGEIHNALDFTLPYEYALVYLAYKEEVTRVLKHLLDLYEDILNSMIEDCVQLMQGIAISYCFLILLLYVFLYLPAINKVREEVTNVWENTRLIPISLIQRYLKDKSLTL